MGWRLGSNCCCCCCDWSWCRLPLFELEPPVIFNLPAECLSPKKQNLLVHARKSNFNSKAMIKKSNTVQIQFYFLPCRWVDELLIDLSTFTEGWPCDRLGCEELIWVPCFELDGILPWGFVDGWLPGTEAEGWKAPEGVWTPCVVGICRLLGFDECLWTCASDELACFWLELAWKMIYK